MNVAYRPDIHFNHRLGQDPLPAAAGPQMVYALLEVVAQGESALGTQVPLNICLVLDQSLSMRGEKMERVAEAARQVFRRMGPRDALSVVSFNDRATVVLPAQVSPLAQHVDKAIDSIVPRGGTELATGIKAGLDELQRGRNLAGRAISSLVLLTDGRTYGDELVCLELAERARAHEFLVTPFGVGDEWNEDLLETIAYRSGSRSELITDPAAIVGAFDRHIGELRMVCGRQVQLTLRTAPETRLAQVHRVAPLIGRVELLPGPNVSEQTYLLGHLMLGESQRLLLEVVLPPVGGGLVDLVHCSLVWQPPDTRQSRLRADYLVTAPVDPFAGPTGELDSEVRLGVEKVVAYKLQKRAWQDLEEGNLAQATSRLRMVATRLLAAGEPDLARAVQAEAERLEREGITSSIGTKQIKYGTRGLGRSQSAGPTGRMAT